MIKPLKELTSVEDVNILKAKPLLTAKEYAILAGLSELTVRRHCYSGEIPSKKIGRSLRIVNTLQ